MTITAENVVRITSVPTTGAGGKVSLHWCATKDSVASILTAGAFNAKRAGLKVDDYIMVAGAVGGTGDFLILRVDTVPAAGNVIVSAETGASGA